MAMFMAGGLMVRRTMDPPLIKYFNNRLFSVKGKWTGMVEKTVVNGVDCEFYPSSIFFVVEDWLFNC